MNGSSDPERDAEVARVGRAYAAYQRSGRRRRAWAADNPGNRAMREELLRAVLEEAGPELASGGDVLDVGCGTGHWPAALREAGTEAGRLYAIDILPERVAAAAARTPGARVRQADARALPFEDGRLVVVLLFTVLSSLGGAEDVRRALTEARRVLAPSGVLLCYEPRLPNPLNRRVRRVRGRDFELAGIRPRRERRLTLLPPLARALGRATTAAYPRLVAVPALRSHRLVAYRKGQA